MNFLALSACVVDFYPQFKKSYLGGNSLNQASMWKKLGVKNDVSIAAAIGKDDNGQRILDFLRRMKINTEYVYQLYGNTANNQLRVDEFGERFGIEGTWSGGVYENFLLGDKDWQFVKTQNVIATTANNPNFRELLKRKTNNQLVVIDYLDIENKIPIEATIEQTDIALITARENLLPRYKALAEKTGALIIVTLGAKGSYVFHNNDEYYQASIEVSKVVDTTGCGDAYLAAFSYVYANKSSIVESMEAGALAASEILGYFGGVGNAE